uniref:Zona pellucida protein AX 1 n=1 Tax=Echeneis naucrates TaxID=173247 RepID=A0A665WBA8_ECHNA
SLAAQCGYSMESDPWGNTRIYTSLLGCYVDNKVDSGAAHGIWKMTFFTPEPVSMVLREAEQAGYAAMATSSRLVMRSPYNTAETYSEDVSNAPISVSFPYVVNLAAACPTGGVLFTEELISWHVPRRVTPLIDGSFKILEMHMGINGQRLEKSQMATRGYRLSTTDFHIVIEIPVGSPDGYYKSHAPDYQYHITYSVEPMLDVLWKADETKDENRYKVLFPITTPLMARPPQAEDSTVAESRLFSVHVGVFLPDVELLNITFSTGVLSVEECNAKGFTVNEHSLPDGRKSFSLQVSFDADVVLKHVSNTQTFLPFILVLPTLSGTCDKNLFYVSVAYGSQGDNFQTMIGSQHLTTELGEVYNFKDNGTHFSLVVPYQAKDVVFEVGEMQLLQLTRLSTCHPNGTITALAVKVESVPNLDPSLLTLKDTSCKPTFSDARFAHFAFAADSCGTTRTTVAFSYKPRSKHPAAEIGSGQLLVQMRLAQDLSYSVFYNAEDYPVVKYLREPLYFEVELIQSTDPYLELILENCWATLDIDRKSLPSWDIIVDSCPNNDDSYVTVFLPVTSDARVAVPSHFKRFSMKMFTFTKDDEVLKDEIYIHCDAVICDTNSQTEACRGQCVHHSGMSNSAHQGLKGVKRGK